LAAIQNQDCTFSPKLKTTKNKGTTKAKAKAKAKAPFRLPSFLRLTEKLKLKLHERNVCTPL
jgi:hypothetical protein